MSCGIAQVAGVVGAVSLAVGVGTGGADAETDAGGTDVDGAGVDGRGSLGTFTCFDLRRDLCVPGSWKILLKSSPHCLSPCRAGLLDPMTRFVR